MYSEKKRVYFRILSIPVSALAVVLAHFLKTPNPMMICIIPVVFFCYMDGYIGGFLSGLVAVFYSLYFFSNPGELFTYNALNMQKVGTIVAAVSIIVILVGKLKQRDIKAIREREDHLKAMTILNAELDQAVLAAQSANKAKSQFLSSVSHDIRTPMNIILGMTHLAQDELENTEAVADCLEKINTSGNFLLGLINNVLDISKIESGELKLNFSTYRLADFIDDVRTMYQPLCDQKRITLDVADPVELPTIRVDKIRFKQVFFNLMSNAVKFTPEGGTIRFAIDIEEVRDGVAPCAFSVADTGVGMSQEFQKEMFTPFTQEHTAYTAKIQGTGLGLPIVKSIVDVMGGKIEADSQEGRGTVFTVYLNLQVVDHDHQAELTIQDTGIDLSKLSGKNILLAEDNPLNAKIANSLLMKKGVVVTWAEDGHQAFETFQNSPDGFFDAVLMDIQMPGTNGLESAALIRALERGDAKSVPIIAMTANAFDEDVEKSIQSGMNLHLTKPIKPNLLYETLASIMK